MHQSTVATTQLEPQERTTLIQLENITKQFPGVLALDDVSFDIRRGEVLALLGENGAGKSTIIKLLSGVYSPSGGQILMRGEPVVMSDPHQAQALGVTTIYQETTLAPDLNAIQNIFLGRELKKWGVGPFGALLDERAMRQKALALYEEFASDTTDLYRPISGLGALKQKVVEILKALAFDADLVIMDEPTAPLADHERDILFDHVRRLKNRGISVLLVTHRLEELFGLVDRAVVLRDGRYIGSVEPEQVGTETLVRMMVGRDVASIGDLVASHSSDTGPVQKAEEILRVEGVSRTAVLEDISFTLHTGEILGIGGLAGSGRTELARVIAGADKIDAGSVSVDGRPLTLRSPRDAIRHGIALVPEERKVQGIFPEFSVERNISAAGLWRLLLARFVIDRRRESRAATEYVDQLHIRTPSIRQQMRLLSGGNQQKAIIARCLFAQSRLLIFDEPTQGIDVGAKLEVYRLIDEHVRSGGAAIVISSELPELLGISDRILVMRQGRIAGELPGGRQSHLTNDEQKVRQEQIMQIAIGGNDA